MNIRYLTHLSASLAAALLCTGMAHAASAAVGAGQFNLSGAVYVTNSEILFGYKQTPPPGDQLAGVLVPSEGAFSSLKAGDVANIGNLLTPAVGGPVTPGTPFLLNNWIQLSDGINADLTDIPVLTSVPVCTGSEGLGAVCRVNAQSPVILQQGVTGVTATLEVLGQAHYAGSSVDSPLKGLLAANFTMGPDSTISGLLGDYAKNGFIMTGYSGNFSTTTAAGVPEPASAGLLGLSLLGFVWLSKKKRLV